jgi:dienelactone hydrolase
MKRLIFVFLFFNWTCFLLAQKPVIDSKVYGKWPKIISYSISNNGNYAAYLIYHKSVSEGSMFIIQATRSDWKTEIQCKGWSYFTQDSRRFLYTNTGDSLVMITLGDSTMEYIPNVQSFKLIQKDDKEWLIYQLNIPGGELVARNLGSGKRDMFNSVTAYFVNGAALLLQKKVGSEAAIKYIIEWVDLFNDRITNIWEGEHADGFIFDETNLVCAFKVRQLKNTIEENSFWYYKEGMNQAVMLADNHSIGMDSSLMLGDLIRFSNDGSRLFFNLEEKDRPKSNPDLVKVDVWSYKDPILQSEQLEEVGARSYVAVIRFRDHQIVRLEQNVDERGSFEALKGYKDDRVGIIFKNMVVSQSEWKWNPASRGSIYLVSTENGSRQLISRDLLGFVNYSYKLSPDGAYLVYYDALLRDYFSYHISTGIVRDITQRVRGRWITSAQNDMPSSNYLAIGYAGWLKGGNAVLIYDQHDIIQVDLSGKLPPINLTNGFGRKHNIVFRFGTDLGNEPVVDIGQKIILKAFDRNNKNDGFYCITLGKVGDPHLLTMQPYMFDGPDESEAFTSYPVKARDAEGYLVRRQSASESPNLFYTTDFRFFSRLSSISPEKEFNWLTNELITWKTKNGTLSQGILYKPEDFDPKRKYPIIFYYYETFSETLHQFREPIAEGAMINIPFYVSNGYLVFLPDIHYPIGSGQGKGVYNSVYSAAQYLAKMPWVDTRRMGIDGHSRGGYETDYLITHTTVFAAAIAGSGYCDLISLYNCLRDNGSSRQNGFETGPQRIGSTLWNSPELYINNSPVLMADKVTTPLLMMNNKIDGDVPFTQGEEFFASLRRLGKKVWMLQYDGQGHIVFGKAKEDLSIRMKQFFDYYLKGDPAPRWMVEGIRASRKGIDNGLELEPAGVAPGPGLLTPEEQKKVDALRHRKPITITIN